MIWRYRRQSRAGGLRYFPGSPVILGTGAGAPVVTTTPAVVMRFSPIMHPLMRHASTIGPPVVHPRMLGSMPTLWPSRCTIQLVTFTSGAGRQQVPTGATTVTGLLNVLCRLAPIIFDRPTDNEIRSQAVLEQYVRRQCKLNGYFPQIVPRVHQAVVDGVTYPIRGVEADSERWSTRLTLEVIYPHG